MLKKEKCHILKKVTNAVNFLKGWDYRKLMKSLKHKGKLHLFLC